MKMRPEEMPDDDHELVIERVCAIDVAKASGKVCVAKLTGARVASSLTRRQLRAVLDAAAEVMRDVLTLAARRSTRRMSTSTASPATSIGRWTPTDARDCPAGAAER
jgi:hypothetical protein